MLFLIRFGDLRVLSFTIKHKHSFVYRRTMQPQLVFAYAEHCLSSDTVHVTLSTPLIVYNNYNKTSPLQNQICYLMTLL